MTKAASKHCTDQSSSSDKNMLLGECMPEPSVTETEPEKQWGSKHNRQEAVREREKQSDKHNPGRQLPIVLAWMCFCHCSIQPHSPGRSMTTCQAGITSRPWHDQRCESRVNSMTANMSMSTHSSRWQIQLWNTTRVTLRFIVLRLYSTIFLATNQKDLGFFSFLQAIAQQAIYCISDICNGFNSSSKQRCCLIFFYFSVMKKLSCCEVIAKSALVLSDRTTQFVQQLTVSRLFRLTNSLKPPNKLSDVKQRKAANPHVSEAATCRVWAF